MNAGSQVENNSKV